MQPALPSSSASVLNLYRNIWLHARGARLQLVGSALLLIGSQLIKLSIPWLTAQAINSLQQGGSSSGFAAAGWVASIILVYAAAYTGTWIALLTPVLVTIALKIRQLTPDEAAVNHSVVLSVGAFFALASNPFFGRLSDRTTSRYAARSPSCPWKWGHS